MRISRNLREIRFHSWNGTLTEGEFSIAIRRPIGMDALPSPGDPFRPPRSLETGVIPIPGDSHVQGSGPRTGTIRESVSRLYQVTEEAM